MDEFISVKEFARLAKVSTQAIYQRLDKDLQEFASTINGKKMLNREGLKLFGIDEAENELDNDTQATTNLLTSQLAEKDKLIQELMQQLSEERRHNRELTDKVAQLADQAQQLQAQQQQLIAQERQERQLQLTTKQERKPNIFERIFKRNEQ